MDVGGELVGNPFLFKTESEKLSIVNIHCDSSSSQCFGSGQLMNHKTFVKLIHTFSWKNIVAWFNSLYHYTYQCNANAIAKPIIISSHEHFWYSTKCEACAN